MMAVARLLPPLIGNNYPTKCGREGAFYSLAGAERMGDFNRDSFAINCSYRLTSITETALWEPGETELPSISVISEASPCDSIAFRFRGLILISIEMTRPCPIHLQRLANSTDEPP